MTERPQAAHTDAARAVLRTNDRGGYTVPTDRLYPFQWNWDSAFVAMGWGIFDEPRAWQELHRLLEGQWEDGLVPQIVFHAPSDDYFPGPEVWGVQHDPPTSGITQPPVLATATRRLLDRTRDHAAAEAEASAIYPKLLASHRWWAEARDPGRTGLVATLHPWETGMDNSPAWDSILDRVPTETTSEIRRRDTTHIDPAFRPRAIDYQRFIHLVDLFRAEGWEAARMLRASPFRVADIGTNAILARAERDLLALAARFGSAADRATIEARLARAEPAIETLWQEAAGLYRSRDLIGGEILPASTSAGFLPLFGGVHRHAAQLAKTLESWLARVRYAVPSTDPAHPMFEPLRYWRGPVWAVVNWMIAEGFASAGQAAQATRIRADTRALIGREGFSEYFDPTTGQGIGGGTFSWTAAIELLLAEETA
ncbi:neutral trehalase [Pseudoroseomonas wenyumeiae]|uniref:Neutral trehalase n=1 Tax=Teichococcus wenyumeiae TaxID=2478470 RepID=A0A3A9JG17_9PROT|nr:trehalase family glycosidase [Pseudoroseomonas wenyumeiae]RKK03445.1 neutral trehalase [Pseudoroseomonas wenyumeiae]RMI27098.1 neutral trehalase [Pseudoroseomonas wenyumeiae]